MSSSITATPVGPVVPTPSTSDDLRVGQPHVGGPEPGRLVEMRLVDRRTPGQVGDRPRNAQQALGAATAGPFQIGELDDPSLGAADRAGRRRGAPDR